MKLRNAIEKPNLTAVPIEQAKSQLENFEEYRCVVISVDDETPMPYYDEAIVELKYYKEGNVFSDSNGNDWGINEILYVYLPVASTPLKQLSDEEINVKLETALRGLADYFKWLTKDLSFHEYVNAMEALKQAEEIKKDQEQNLFVTGWRTNAERLAYDTGREHESKVLLKFIQDWNGSKNSALGQILHDKLNLCKCEKCDSLIKHEDSFYIHGEDIYLCAKCESNPPQSDHINPIELLESILEQGKSVHPEYWDEMIRERIEIFKHGI